MKSILENMNKCTGCSSCSQSCVSGCISMLPNEEGFLFPNIDGKKCTDCGVCIKACPIITKGSILYEDEIACKETTFPKVFACLNTCDDVRFNSSSGGAFSAFAQNVLPKGGVVFGAAFRDDFSVYHTYIEDQNKLDTLRRSKYVQSDISGSFKKVLDFLKEGRKVMFTGTPCQIGGLKAFLGRDYSELLTFDIACHGVPSPKIWSMYLDYIKSIYKSKITTISFRHKKDGWQKSSMKIDFDSNQSYIDNVYKEPYFIGFGKSIFNRECCFNCDFKLHNTKADITLADFWGIDKLPHTDSLKKHGLEKGVSLVIVNTTKGKVFLDEITDKIYIEERAYNEAVIGNPRLLTSSHRPKGRTPFFKDVKKGLPFKKLKSKYMNNSGFIYNMKKIAKVILKK